jgi:hypothetical protein
MPGLSLQITAFGSFMNGNAWDVWSHPQIAAVFIIIAR